MKSRRSSRRLGVRLAAAVALEAAMIARRFFCGLVLALALGFLPAAASAQVRGAPAARGPSETISAAQAQRLFAELAGRRDIAFRFPADGCYARAHLMCVQLFGRGVRPRKVWTFANGQSLRVRTANHPDGFVQWGYHVAPLVRVRFGTGASARDRDMVFDPSMFPRPVTIQVWQMAQAPSRSHLPHVRVTRFGEAPVQPSTGRRQGSGYWPGDDPQGDLTQFSLRVMAKYKPFEGKRMPSR
jgi:Glutaminase